MRNALRKTMEILDGTPAVYGEPKQTRGQSVVELALVTPILIVLLMGLAEIGWFANNYIILLEVTRVGARLGTTLTDSLSPLKWNNDASRVHTTGWGDFPPNIGLHPIADYHDCAIVRDKNSGVDGFYSHIACLMTQQMDPLVYNPNNGIDDIVISAFALQAIDPTALPTTNFKQDPGGTTAGSPPANMFTNPTDATLNTLNTAYTGATQMVVVGRYPANANECTVDINGVSGKVWERDPFDYFQDSKRDYQLQDLTASPLDPSDGSNRNYVELEGIDAPTNFPYAGAPTMKPERQRGWALSGNHGITNVKTPAGVKQCIGSDWTIKNMEGLMNVPTFSLLSGQRQYLPNQGVILVELFWKHELLLKNPVFNPVWTVLGADTTTISVWAAFPLASTEPRVNFLKP